MSRIYLLYLYRFNKVRKEMARTFKDIEIEGKKAYSIDLTVLRKREVIEF